LLAVNAPRHETGSPQSPCAVTPNLPRRIQQRMRLVISCLLLMLPCCAFAQGGACPNNWNSIDPNGSVVGIASYAGIKSCYYASKSIGSDSAYDGTSETISGSHGPFAHIPGMNGCTGNCARVTPTAGQGFIMRGGDTWSGSDLGVYWAPSGTANNQIYIGVDQGWFYSSTCGASWCRPIWNMSSVSRNVFLADGASRYWWFDNVEITGMNNAINGVYVQHASNIRASQLYFHGWTHTGGVGNNVGFFSQGGSGTMADHNVMDGSDSSKNTMNGFFSEWANIQYNYINYVVSGLIGTSDTVHDNVLHNTVLSADGDHCNGFFSFAPLSGTSQLMYNNVINMGSGCGGGVNLWFNGNGSTGPTWVGYGFGNIIYNTSGSNLIDIGNHGAGNYGTYYIFNNVVDCTNGGCGGTLPVGPYFAIYDQNNYTIGGDLSFDSTPSGGSVVGPCNNGKGAGCTDLNQTLATANAQGYTASSQPPYEPSAKCTKSTCSTNGSGADLLSSICGKLQALDSAAFNACTKGTTAGVAYNTSNHTVTKLGVTAVARPSGIWDIGAYQVGSGTGPASPTNLTGSVQ
jgi:hypothetical protein